MKSIKVYSTALPSSSAVTDTILTRIWDEAPHKPLDVEIWIRLCKWTSVSDHSQGFTELGTINLTQYLPWEYQLRIMEEVEDFRSGQFGVIRGSNLTQRFLEETRGINIGTILKQVLTQNYSSTSDYYTYASEDVHLWELILKVGHEKTSRWISPPFSWIYGWLFDAATEALPRFTVNKGNSQTFELAGDSLLTWMDRIDSKNYLGDFLNPSGRWQWGGTYADNLFTDVCNAPTIVVLNKILDTMGVLEEDRDVALAPDVESTKEYSSMDYWDLSTNNALCYAPDVHFWKTDGDDEYTVTIKDVFGVPTLRITVWNTVTGKYAYYDKVITTTASAYAKRIWYTGTGNTFYVGIEYPTNAWKLVICTLSGTKATGITLAENFSSAIALTLPASYFRNWGQTDLLAGANRLYASLCYNGTSWAGVGQAHSYLDIGYWDLSDGSWNNLYTYSDTIYTWIVPECYNTLECEGNKLSGFKVLSDGGHNQGVAFFALKGYLASGSYYFPRLGVIVYDETQNAISFFEYEQTILGGTTASNYVMGSRWRGYPFVNDDTVPYTGAGGTQTHYQGRGTIGGFYDSTATTFEFVLSSYDARLGYWIYYTPGADPATATLTQVTSGYSYRSFVSNTGAPDAEATTGVLTDARQDAETDDSTRRVYVDHRLIYCWKDGATRKATTEADIGHDYEFDIADDYQFPLISAPSLLPYSSAPTTPYKVGGFRPFVIIKPRVYDAGWESYRVFVTILSTEWYQNFSKDFSAYGGSFAQEVNDMIFATGSIARFDLHGTVVKKRYDDSSPTIDKTLTAGNWMWNSQTAELIGGYEIVKVAWSDTEADVFSSSGSQNSRNILEVNTDYCPTQPRAQSLADRLYALHSANRWRFKVTTFDQFTIQPLDNLSLELELTPGGQGFSAKNVMVLASEINGHHVDLTVVELGSTTGVAF